MYRGWPVGYLLFWQNPAGDGGWQAKEAQPRAGLHFMAAEEFAANLLPVYWP